MNSITPTATLSSFGDTLGSPSPPTSFPNDPNSPPLPSWFTDMVPSQWLNTSGLPGDDILTRLMRMINWMSVNPTNLNAPMVFLQFVSAVMQDGNLTQQQKSTIESLLNSPDLTNSQGESVLDQAIDSAYQLYFYNQYYATNPPNNNPSYWTDSLTSFLQNMGQMFQGDGLGVNTYINQLLSNNTIASYVADQLPGGNILYSQNTAYTNIENEWGNNAISWQLNGVGGWINAASSAITTSLQNTDDNAYTATSYIFEIDYTLQTDNMGGLGGVSNFLTGLVTSLNNMVSGWQDGSFTATSATTYIQNIENFLTTVQNNPMTQGIAANITASLNGILNMPTTFPNPNSPGQDCTIQQLCGLATQTPPVQGAAQSLATLLNSFEPPSNNTGAIPAQYTTFLNDLKQTITDLTNETQTLTTTLSQDSNTSQSFLNLLKSILNELKTLLSTINQNMAKS